METAELIGLLILVFIGIPVGIGLLLYFVPKKLGYPKTAKYLIRAYLLLVLMVAIFALFEDHFFTKNDAKKLVEEQNIFLPDKFDLLKNESMSAIGDYYHTFKLRISDRDREQAIMEIKNSVNFRPEGVPGERILNLRKDPYFGPKIILNYETGYSYVREYFQPSGRQGYAPTFRRISISKTTNELEFEDIDE